MWVNVSDLPVTCVLLPLMTTIRQAEPENPLWHSWKSHCDQSSPEVERDSGLAKEIVRELSREKKEFSIRKRTKIYKHIITYDLQSQDCTNIFPLLLQLKTCLQRISSEIRNFELWGVSASRLSAGWVGSARHQGRCEGDDYRPRQVHIQHHDINNKNKNSRNLGILMPVYRIYTELWLIHNTY